MSPSQHITAPKSVVILGGAHGSLALARSLGRNNVPVYYVTNDSPLASWSRYVKKTIRWTGPEAGNAPDELREIAKTHDLSGSVLVAASDQDVKFVSQYASELSSLFRFFLPDWDRLKWLCDKPHLYRRAGELQIGHPTTYEIASLEAASRQDFIFPIVLKPNMGGGNSTLAKAKVVRVDDKASFDAVFGPAAQELGAENIVVQRLISGGGESQLSYAAFWYDGAPVGEFTARRRRQYPVDFGFTSTLVETIDEPEVIVAARKLLASVGFSGLVEVEFKRDPVDGTLNVLDVNPRPWSWFALSAACGMDFARMIWEVANKRSPPVSSQYNSAVSWMYLSRDIIAAAVLMTRGQLRLSDYLKSLLHVRAWAAFSWSDLKPGIVDLPITAIRVLTRRLLNISK